MRDGTECRDVDFGVDLRGIGLAVTEHLPDLRERRAAAQEVGCQRVAQQMRAFERRIKAGALQRVTHDAANDRKADESSPWHPDLTKHTTLGANRSIAAQIVGDGGAHIGGSSTRTPLLKRARVLKRGWFAEKGGGKRAAGTLGPPATYLGTP
jgi:hypothetical protein